MDVEKLNKKLYRAVKKQLPAGNNMAKVIMDVFYLGKEAVYRRLRGDVLLLSPKLCGYPVNWVYLLIILPVRCRPIVYYLNWKRVKQLILKRRIIAC